MTGLIHTTSGLSVKELFARKQEKLAKGLGRNEGATQLPALPAEDCSSVYHAMIAFNVIPYVGYTDYVSSRDIREAMNAYNAHQGDAILVQQCVKETPGFTYS